MKLNRSEIKKLMRPSSLLVQGLLLLLLLSGACKKSDSADSASSEAPPTPAVPATPVPSFSAAQKIGMFAYAKVSQNNDQQLRNKFDCYTQVQQQTRITQTLRHPQVRPRPMCRLLNSGLPQTLPNSKLGELGEPREVQPEERS
jgi:hypothetical protein